jgi:ketopantoate hydroxymethyltransferase
MSRIMAEAFTAYAEDVREGRFPDLDHSYPSE